MALRWGGASESGLEGGEALVDEDGTEDEDADGGDAVDNDEDLEIEAVTEMRYESGQAIPIAGRTECQGEDGCDRYPLRDIPHVHLEEGEQCKHHCDGCRIGKPHRERFNEILGRIRFLAPRLGDMRAEHVETDEHDE